MAVKSGATVQNAEEFVHAISNKIMHITVEEVFQTEINEVKKYFEKEFNHISAIPGTHRVHYSM